MSRSPKTLARLSLLATSTLMASSSSASHASVHHLRTHETLWNFARRYHTTVRALERVNHIHNPTQLPSHMLLRLPPPEKHVWLRGNERVAAKVTRNRVAVRMGPGESYHRETLIDAGDELHIVRRRDGWSEIHLADGKLGWIRDDMLHASAASLRRAKEASSHRKVRIASSRTSRESLAHHRRLYLEHLHRLHLKEEHLHKLHLLRLAQKEHHWHGRTHLAYAKHTAYHRGLIRTALAYRGIPYVFGGSSPRGFDCSGFTRYIYRKKGIYLPHNADAQFHMGTPVSKSHLRPGDLVFFHTVAPGISHVGMYIGNDKFIHASSPNLGGVRVDSLSEAYYERAYRGARRYTRK